MEDPASVSLPRPDPHSYANAHEVRVRHLELDLQVCFDDRVLRGSVELEVERVRPDIDVLVVDTRDLLIRRVVREAGGGTEPASFRVGTPDAIMGAPLTIALTPDTTRVRVDYETGPRASALQWLTPQQTIGKRHPFLFTQSQAIHARSWLPLQDSPGVRATYRARIQTPGALRAVMSAAHEPEARENGVYHFHMPQPIPAYLIALAVGELAFEAMGTRTGVFAEPSRVGAAAREFEDTEAMMQAVEGLYGPYRWDRFDLLVLPPSFPFGGMENPRVTFATPTILAGDKSLVSLVAHELAHSWSGNLVTNGTWNDFWLNEGFTTYIERRVLEVVFGRKRAEMEAVLGLRVLDAELHRLESRDTRLHLDLGGRDPDVGLTAVAYEKGALFLRQLEKAVGRDRFDRFLRDYFAAFAFQSIRTSDFVGYLDQELGRGAALHASGPDVEQWIEGEGIPSDAVRPSSSALARVESLSDRWVRGHTSASGLRAHEWTTQEWLHFLRSLPDGMGADRLAELDEVYALTRTRNAEIAHVWLRLAIDGHYAPADQRLEAYLLEVGRRKLIEPLYRALAATPEGLERARLIYRRARPGYHPIAAETLDRLLLDVEQ